MFITSLISVPCELKPREKNKGYQAFQEKLKGVLPRVAKSISEYNKYMEYVDLTHSYKAHITLRGSSGAFGGHYSFILNAALVNSFIFARWRGKKLSHRNFHEIALGLMGQGIEERK